jgi:hypothetical protein
VHRRTRGDRRRAREIHTRFPKRRAVKSARMNARSVRSIGARVHRVRDGVWCVPVRRRRWVFGSSIHRIARIASSSHAYRRRRRRRRRAPTHGLLINPRRSSSSGVATDRYRSIDRYRPRDRSR